ncbi:MAG: toprim domain-containing protein [Clostridiales bacterium]|nr:toprim domain-containing protein [Clostridiales bacterium]
MRNIRTQIWQSAIDLLSFATLRKLHGLDWNSDHLLSLAGIYQPKKELSQSAVPLALTQYLNDHPEVKRIVLRLDNDRAGHMAAKAIMAVLPENYTAAARFPPRGKDYNDYLCSCLGLRQTRYPRAAER